MARMALLLVVLLGLLAIGNVDAYGARSTRRLKQAYAKPEDTYTTPQDSYTKPQDPSSITIRDWTYTLMTVPQPFNWLAATVQKGCPPNSRFSGFATKKDKDAIMKIARHVKIWVNADTYNGTVPVKMPGCQNITWIDNTALPKLPYVCKAPVLKRKWMTIDKTLYVLTGTLIDFNTLATTKGNCSQGCPEGMTWSTMTGDDATAAVKLAPHFTIWVNDITINGRVPVKLAEQDRMTYFDNQELPWMPFICKGPAPIIQWLT